ncbi:MAG: iron-sulfur cluster assembly protein, partial [Verrucomicrobiota bacterium]|nr:iron-sulfur cluster assembly protein [Verrucomicrobiota bacterium]
MSISESQIAKVLEGIKYPGYSRNIISFGLVKEVEVDGNDVRIRLAINSQDPSIPEQIKTEVEAAVAAVEGVGGVEIV